MTRITDVAGCSICGGMAPLCRTCVAMERAFTARAEPPLSVEWARAQQCSADAKRVLLALITKSDFETGFTQLSLQHIAKEIHGLWRDDRGGEGYLSDGAAAHVAQQLRALVAAGLLETLPPLPETPWVLRWLARRGKTPDGMLWLRLKHRDAPRQWDHLAA